ncbi:esterase family protein [Olivibacter sp. SDN3]|uniref:alpha/beta hydrolase n=1 Tax=Olivibacter sp. SDN3 TaxID=2764720 RepID=UPI0016513B6B|nr:alpha/beta hydrolase family protein [Olivibacter sp. SDN3]QNL49005.1 esterase family protein [Olivibacter sp. SDN3]
MRVIVFFSIFIFWRFLAYGANVDTVSTPSVAMGKNIKAVIVTPDSYKDSTKFPVVYLLHGYSGNYSDWINNAPEITNLADRYQFIVVCPDGGYSSWYWDNTSDKNFQYETYVARELTEWVDSNYRTIRDKNSRAITGLSMGGHGALYLAFRHQNIFGAAGSMSGGVDIRPFPDNWDISKRIGTYADHPERWEAHTVINMLHLLKPGGLALMIDCGVNDFFFTVNEDLHQKLLEKGVGHDYIVRPGKHDWNYWKNSVSYQLLFMHRFFTNK